MASRRQLSNQMKLKCNGPKHDSPEFSSAMNHNHYSHHLTFHLNSMNTPIHIHLSTQTANDTFIMRPYECTLVIYHPNICMAELSREECDIKSGRNWWKTIDRAKSSKFSIDKQFQFSRIVSALCLCEKTFALNMANGICNLENDFPSKYLFIFDW